MGRFPGVLQLDPDAADGPADVIAGIEDLAGDLVKELAYLGSSC